MPFSFKAEAQLIELHPDLIEIFTHYEEIIDNFEHFEIPAGLFNQLLAGLDPELFSTELVLNLKTMNMSLPFLSLKQLEEVWLSFIHLELLPNRILEAELTKGYALFFNLSVHKKISWTYDPLRKTLIAKAEENLPINRDYPWKIYFEDIIYSHPFRNIDSDQFHIIEKKIEAQQPKNVHDFLAALYQIKNDHPLITFVINQIELKHWRLAKTKFTFFASAIQDNSISNEALLQALHDELEQSQLSIRPQIFSILPLFKKITENINEIYKELYMLITKENFSTEHKEFSLNCLLYLVPYLPEKLHAELINTIKKFINPMTFPSLNMQAIEWLFQQGKHTLDSQINFLFNMAIQECDNEIIFVFYALKLLTIIYPKVDDSKKKKTWEIFMNIEWEEPLIACSSLEFIEENFHEFSIYGDLTHLKRKLLDKLHEDHSQINSASNFSETHKLIGIKKKLIKTKRIITKTTEHRLLLQKKLEEKYQSFNRTKEKALIILSQMDLNPRDLLIIFQEINNNQKLLKNIHLFYRLFFKDIGLYREANINFKILVDIKTCVLAYEANPKHIAFINLLDSLLSPLTFLNDIREKFFALLNKNKKIDISCLSNDADILVVLLKNEFDSPPPQHLDFIMLNALRSLISIAHEEIFPVFYNYLIKHQGKIGWEHVEKNLVNYIHDILEQLSGTQVRSLFTYFYAQLEKETAIASNLTFLLILSPRLELRDLERIFDTLNCFTKTKINLLEPYHLLRLKFEYLLITKKNAASVDDEIDLIVPKVNVIKLMKLAPQHSFFSGNSSSTLPTVTDKCPTISLDFMR